MIPNQLAFDGDWLAYTAACWAETEGVDYLEDRLKYDVNETVERLGLTSPTIEVAFSCTRAENYRRKFWPLYKSHRDGQEPPALLATAKEMLAENYPVIVRPNLEADDILATRIATGEWVGVAIDKDMRQVPGWHFNPRKEDTAQVQGIDEALDFFLCQAIAGDSTDYIFGALGRGEAWYRKNIQPLPILERPAAILQAYTDSLAKPGKRYIEKAELIRESMTDLWGEFEDFKSYARTYALSQIRCLYLLRTEAQWDSPADNAAWTPEYLASDYS